MLSKNSHRWSKEAGPAFLILILSIVFSIFSGELGKVTSLDVFTAQVSLINSKASYVNYYGNYQTALAQLRKIMDEGETSYEK
jgi:hypothetical protein